MRQFLYVIKLHSGERIEVQAESAGDAIRLAGCSPADVRPWYPMAVKAIPTEEEKGKSRERIKAMIEKKREIAANDAAIQARSEANEVGYINQEMLLCGACFEGNHRQCTGSNACARDNVCHCACMRPEVEHLSTGEVQAILPTTPRRTVPTGTLRPRKAQNTNPLPLEMPAIEAKQGRLF